VANGIFGSIDANRGDPQNGWDTDQFPNSVDDLALAVYEILRAGGFTTGGFNFDAKLRRQSLDRTDLFHGHIGGADTLARALLAAAELIERETLATMREQRYAGWNDGLGQEILEGTLSLADLAIRVTETGLDPQPRSGRQEQLENVVNQAIWAADQDSSPTWAVSDRGIPVASPAGDPTRPD
jgi:xylose isomerase